MLNSKQLPIYTSCRHRLILGFIWSHVCVHLTKESLIFILLFSSFGLHLSLREIFGSINAVW